MKRHKNTMAQTWKTKARARAENQKVRMERNIGLKEYHFINNVEPKINVRGVHCRIYAVSVYLRIVAFECSLRNW